MKDLKVPRRTVLSGTSAGQARVLIAATPQAVDVGVSVPPLPRGAVTPQAGLLRPNRDLSCLSYLGFVERDRPPHTYRPNAGLPSPAQPVRGWKPPATEPRGHSTGHPLTAGVTLFPLRKTHRQRCNVYGNIAGVPLPAFLPAFVGHHRFNRASGTSAADATGNGRTASAARGTWTSLTPASEISTLP